MDHYYVLYIKTETEGSHYYLYSLHKVKSRKARLKKQGIVPKSINLWERPYRLAGSSCWRELPVAWD